MRIKLRFWKREQPLEWEEYVARKEAKANLLFMSDVVDESADNAWNKGVDANGMFR